MSETRYEVWWSGKKEWAEPCKIADKHDGLAWIDDHNGKRSVVPLEWLHPVEPEIAPGTLVYAWTDDEQVRRMGGKAIGEYRQTVNGEHCVRFRFLPQPVERWFDHVEPIAQEPEIKWGKLDPGVKLVAVYDSGIVYCFYNDDTRVGDQDADGTIIRIIPRPKS